MKEEVKKADPLQKVVLQAELDEKESKKAELEAKMAKQRLAVQRAKEMANAMISK